MKLAKIKAAILAFGLGLGFSASFTAVSSTSCWECEQRWNKCLEDHGFVYCNRTVGCHLC